MLQFERFKLMPARKRKRRAGAAQGRAFGRFRAGGRVRRQPRGAGELKFHDVDFDNEPVASGGAIEATINVIPQGITESERIGRKCTITNIGWRYDIFLVKVDAQATATNGDVLRVILYLDKQTNGATATVLNILQTADYQSFNNLSNKGRFTILMDKTHVINYLSLASDNAGVVSSANVTRSFTFFKKTNINIEYDDSAATGALTTIRTNNLGILTISREGQVRIVSKIRLRFSDG